MTCHCPSCKRILYDRCLARCGFCGEAIPTALRFSPAKIVAIKSDLDDMIEEQKKARAAAAAAANDTASALDLSLPLQVLVTVAETMR